MTNQEKLKAIKLAKKAFIRDHYILGFIPYRKQIRLGLCLYLQLALERVGDYKYANPREAIIEFNECAPQLPPPISYWWPMNDFKSRIKCLNKLIKIYENKTS